MTTKLYPAGVGEWAIKRDGETIGKVWFSRNREIINHRVTVLTAGKLTLNDGRSFDLRSYCWWADVRRDIDFIIDNAQ